MVLCAVCCSICNCIPEKRRVILSLSRAISFSFQFFFFWSSTLSNWLCFVRCLGNCKSPSRNHDPFFQYYFLSFSRTPLLCHTFTRPRSYFSKVLSSCTEFWFVVTETPYSPSSLGLALSEKQWSIKSRSDPVRNSLGQRDQ